MPFKPLWGCLGIWSGWNRNDQELFLIGSIPLYHMGSCTGHHGLWVTCFSTQPKASSEEPCQQTCHTTTPRHKPLCLGPPTPCCLEEIWCISLERCNMPRLGSSSASSSRPALSAVCRAAAPSPCSKIVIYLPPTSMLKGTLSRHWGEEKTKISKVNLQYVCATEEEVKGREENTVKYH